MKLEDCVTRGHFSLEEMYITSEKVDIIIKLAKSYLEPMVYKLAQSRMENGNAYFIVRK